MQLDSAIKILKTHETDLKEMGVLSLYVFGSTIRGEQGQDSDVDLFFDYERGKLDLFRLMDIQEKTSEILGCAADITTRDSLHPMIRQDVEASAVQIF